MSYDEDDEKYSHSDKWAVGCYFQLGSSKTTKTGAGGSWGSVYGTTTVNKGKHEWIIEIQSTQQNQNNGWIGVGIATNTIRNNSYFYNNEQDSVCWQNTHQRTYLMGSSQSPSIGQRVPFSGKVRIFLDMDKKQVSFYHPHTSKTPVFTQTGLSAGNWRLAGTLVAQNDGFTIIKSGAHEAALVDTADMVVEYKCTTKSIQTTLKELKELDEDVIFSLLNQCKKSKEHNEALMNAIIEHDKAVKTLEDSMGGLIHPDDKSWRTWNYKSVLRWILSLEDGRYGRYVARLKSELKKQEVCGTDLPEFEKNDLKIFGIDKFKDRTDLFKSIQDLIEGKTIGGAPVPGAEKEGEKAVFGD